jgi:decaprenylphospho-beta-D-erythro-pentofuranosid-2-ulose 2-reductase
VADPGDDTTVNDATGSPQTALVLGGTSEIAVATLTRLAARRCRHIVLACRDTQGGAVAAANSLRSAGATTVDIVDFDAADPASHAATIEAATELLGDIDMVLLAFGVLGSQADFDVDPLAAVAAVNVNYTAAVSCGLLVAQVLRRQGHGTLVVLSSVAGERARADNFVYGSAKAGLDAFSQGLSDSLAAVGAHVLVVRPGFVHTRMTAGMKPAPFSTTADAVADRIVRGLETGAHVVWAPSVLRWVFAVMRHLPRGVWRKVSAR